MATKYSVLLSLMLVFCGPAFAADGQAVGVDPDAEARLDGAGRTLVVGSDIWVGDTVVTGPRGQVQIIFDDETKLVVGRGSSLLIEDYLLRGDHTADRIAINALAGTFRFITGNSPKPAYEINTPTATIGVRGTKFDFVVSRDSTRLVLFEGAVRMCNDNGVCTEVTGHCDLGIATNDGAVLVTRADPARLPLVSDFFYIRFQSPLIQSFRVDGASQCRDGVTQALTPNSTNDTAAEVVRRGGTAGGGSTPSNGGESIPGGGSTPSAGGSGSTPPSGITRPSGSAGSSTTPGGAPSGPGSISSGSLGSFSAAPGRIR